MNWELFFAPLRVAVTKDTLSSSDCKAYLVAIELTVNYICRQMWFAINYISHNYFVSFTPPDSSQLPSKQTYKSWLGGCSQLSRVVPTIFSWYWHMQVVQVKPHLGVFCSLLGEWLCGVWFPLSWLFGMHKDVPVEFEGGVSSTQGPTVTTLPLHSYSTNTPHLLGSIV